MSVWPFLNSLHSVCHAALLLANPDMTVSAISEFWCGKHVLMIKTDSRYELLCRTEFLVMLPLQVNLLCEQVLIDWTLPHLSHVTPVMSATKVRAVESVHKTSDSVFKSAAPTPTPQFLNLWLPLLLWHWFPLPLPLLLLHKSSVSII
jgi:hypothetical protein